MKNVTLQPNGTWGPKRKTKNRSLHPESTSYFEVLGTEFRFSGRKDKYTIPELCH